MIKTKVTPASEILGDSSHSCGWVASNISVRRAFLFFCLRLLTCRHISFHSQPVKLRQYPASKNPILVWTMTSTSKLSYLRYISHLNLKIFIWRNYHNIFPQKVENTLFRVLKNGFNVPGTPFESVFGLPRAQTDSIEGSCFENPIHLPGVKVDHFRSFLRILYPLCVLMILSAKYSRMIKSFSMGQKPVVKFDEWVGVLNLATMWVFQEVRSLLLQDVLCYD